MTSPRAAPLFFALVAAVLHPACSCDRGSSLADQRGELVVVVPRPDGESLTRDAVLTVEPVVMDEVGQGQVRLRNIGVAPLTIVRVTRLSGSDVLSLDDAAGVVIPRDGEVALATHFAPPTLADVTVATVEHRADFTVEVTGGREGEQLAQVSLVGLAVARDCYVPALLDFGAVPLGQHVALPLVLENGKPFPAVTELSAIDGADAPFFGLTAQASTVEVNPGQRVELPVSFGPLEAREYRASLRVRRAPTCGEGVTQLVGRGSNDAIAWGPSPLDFGRVPLSVDVTRELAVTSQAGVALALEGVVVEGAGFALAEPAPSSVPARGRAVLKVNCRPTALGRLSGMLRFDVATAERVSARVPLTCVGGAPRIRLAPSPSLSFGNVPIGGVASRRLSVQNWGTPPASAADTSTNLRLGVDGQLPWVAIVPANATTKVTDFQVVVPAGYDPAKGLPAIAGLNTLDLDVRLLTLDEGRKEADLLVYSNDPVQPRVSVRVSATPVHPGTCRLTINPAYVSMGDIPRGASYDRSITINGDSGTRGCLVSVDLAPGSASNLSLLGPSAPFTIDSGQNRGIVVRATAAPALPHGTTARGFVRVTAGVDPPVLIPVEMRVANCLVLEPGAVDFGTTRVGCRGASTALNAYNACGVPLFIDRLSVRPAGAPFVLTSSPVIPATGLQVSSGLGPVTTHVAFAPTAVGPAQGFLDFDIREGGVPRTVSVDLSGEADLLGLHTDTWTQTGAGKLDILFVVDDSCSMADEQASLASNFASFIAAAQARSVDFRLGVTTTDLFTVSGLLQGSPKVLTPATPGLAQAFASNVQVGTGGAGIERPFEAATRAVTEPLASGGNAGFLRSDAALAVVIVTDAVEQSPNPVAVYVSKLRAVKNNKANQVSVSVVGPLSFPSATCQLDSTVDDGRYASIVRDTNGVLTDICTSNWAQDLANIGENLVQPRLAYPLTAQPGNPSTIQVKVDGVVVTNWSYQASTNSVVFPAGAPPPAGSTVTATYGTPCY